MPGTTDDTYHSILLCTLVSMIQHPRQDLILPMEEPDGGGYSDYARNEYEAPYSDGY